MHRPLLWVLLVVLVAALLFILGQHGPGAVVGLTDTDFALLIVRVALLALIGTTVFVLFRERWSQALLSALAWVAIALVLVIGYTYRFELRDVGQHVLAELIPGHPVTTGRKVEVARGRSGNFSVEAHINGARVSLVLDTGASSVVLTQEAAKAAGLPLEVLNYSVNVETANGRARAAPVTLDRLSVGGITERSVAALIAQPGQLKSSLLGMRFLNRLESWQVRGDRLELRGFP